MILSANPTKKGVARMGEDNQQSTFEAFFEWFSEFKEDHASVFSAADRYIKKLCFFKFLALMVYAMMVQARSLEEISKSLVNPLLAKAIGLASISVSQLSRKLAKIDPEILHLLLSHLMNLALREVCAEKTGEVAEMLRLVDASTISLCFSQYPWAEFRKTKSGVKMHLRLVFVEDTAIPEKVVVTRSQGC